MTKPDLFAFDFDGVLCDGLREYFQVAWRTYCQFTFETDGEVCDPLQPPLDLFDGFAQGRAIVETGWEMPLLLYGLRQRRSVADILDRWPDLLAEFQGLPHIPSAGVLAQCLDAVRDRWIQEDLTGWLALHRFYPGVIEGVTALLNQGHVVAIVSTKEGRFIKQLLADAKVNFPEDRILGKEVKRSKRETLKGLMTEYPHCKKVHFIEDRLAALQTITTSPDLQSVHLYLAGWGYNTARDREVARQDDRIQLIENVSITDLFWGNG